MPPSSLDQFLVIVTVIAKVNTLVIDSRRSETGLCVGGVSFDMNDFRLRIGFDCGGNQSLTVGNY